METNPEMTQKLTASGRAFKMMASNTLKTQWMLGKVGDHYGDFIEKQNMSQMEVSFSSHRDVL